jgi:hypothetical protein
MPRSKNDSGLYEAKGTLHFNVKYKRADAISNRVLARDLKEFRYASNYATSANVCALNSTLSISK